MASLKLHWKLCGIGPKEWWITLSGVVEISSYAEYPLVSGPPRFERVLLFARIAMRPTPTCQLVFREIISPDYALVLFWGPPWILLHDRGKCMRVYEGMECPPSSRHLGIMRDHSKTRS